MTTRLLRLAALVLSAVLIHAPARAQQPLPRALPWGITGEQASALLRDSSAMRIAATRAGREIYAMSTTGPMQAVALLARDTLVGLIYFHPENHAVNAADLFSLAAADAERMYGPAFCRKREVAVWSMEDMILEIRLRRPRGDGAPGSEVRYTRPGYEAEIARRSAPARTASTPASPAGRGRTGPRLLGAPAAQEAPATAPTVAAEPAIAPGPADSTGAPAAPAHVLAVCA
jgi:hypothetical protein